MLRETPAHSPNSRHRSSPRREPPFRLHGVATSSTNTALQRSPSSVQRPTPSLLIQRNSALMNSISAT
eukprot:1323922-Rhodomonas_salina.2